MSEDAQILRERLREAREYLNFTQQFVADRTGIPRTAIAEIEAGKRRVESIELKKLAKLYGYPTSYFFGEDFNEQGQGSIINALARATGDLTDEDKAEVLRFAEFLRFQRSRSKEDS